MPPIKLKQPASRPKRRGIAVQVCAGLLVAVIASVAGAYYAVCSNTFFQMFVVPRANAALNAEFKVTSGRVRPFSGIRMEGVNVTPRGQERLFSARAVQVRCNLLAFLAGDLHLKEIELVAPQINLAENPDGTSNLDPILQRAKAGPQNSSAPSPAATLRVDNVKVTEGSLRQTRPLSGGGHTVAEFTQLNLLLTRLAGGGNGQARVSGRLQIENSERAYVTNASLTAEFDSDIEFTLSAAFQPLSVKGGGTFLVTQAAGKFEQFTGFAARLEADSTPSEIKSLAVRFSRQNTPLGEVRLKGPFNPAEREAKLALEVVNLGSQVLNLFAARSGLEFGETSINATSEVELTKQGRLLSLIGDLHVQKFRATRAGETTPLVELKGDYSLAVDKAAKSALLGAFNLTGTQDQKPLLRAGLTGPMTLAWGDAAEATADAALLVTLSDVNLAEWKPVFGRFASAGTAKLEAKVNSRQTGRILTYECRFAADNLTLLAGRKQLTRLAANVEAGGEAKDLAQFKLNEINGQLLYRGKPTLSLSGAASLDVPQQTTSADFTVLSSVSDLFPALDIPGADATSGALEFTTRLLQKTNTQTISGSFRVAGLSGVLGRMTFLNYSTDVVFELANDARHVHVRKLNGRMHEGSKLGGKFAVAARYDRYTSAVELGVRLADFNQFGLRPYLEALFGNRRVSSLGLNSTLTASRDATGNASVKSDLQLTNLIAIDLKTGIATTPVDLRAQFDAAVAKQIGQIRKGQINLTPTARSKNVLVLTGDLNLTDPAARTGRIKLAADSLDLTKYLDLFGPKTRPFLATQVLTGSAASAAPEMEPEPVNLPYRNLAGELKIGRLYAREVDARELEVVATLNRNQLFVRPCKATVNGSPVTATASVDLGVPGFTYDVVFNAKELALPALVNTFQPERRGQVRGVTTAMAEFKGAGVTSANLQQNLTGQFMLVSSNLHLSLGNTRTPVVRSLANTIVGIPDLLRNPGAALENLIGRLANFGAARGSWADDLMAAPLELMEARIIAGDGRVRVQHAELRSSAFKARATGDIGLSSVLTNSTLHLPISLSLNHNLALKVGLIAAGSPTNASYYATPDFLTMRGTLGKPTTAVDANNLIAMTASASPVLLRQLGVNPNEKLRAFIQTGGDLIGGYKSTVDTNAVPVASEPKVFDLFGSPPK